MGRPPAQFPLEFQKQGQKAPGKTGLLCGLDQNRLASPDLLIELAYNSPSTPYSLSESPGSFKNKAHSRVRNHRFVNKWGAKVVAQFLETWNNSARHPRK
jgi:hypothetical protein